MIAEWRIAGSRHMIATHYPLFRICMSKHLTSVDGFMYPHAGWQTAQACSSREIYCLTYADLALNADLRIKWLQLQRGFDIELVQRI